MALSPARSPTPAATAPMWGVTPSAAAPAAGPGVAPGSAGFGSFPDYSRMNEGRHNGTRQDTFHTPGRMVGAKGRAATRTAVFAGSAVSKTVPGSASGLGTRDLLDMCELSFAKNLRDLHAGLLGDLRACVHEALDPLRDELAATVADSRAVTAFERISRRFESLEIPQFDDRPLKAEIRDALQRQEESMRHVQEQLTQELRIMREELQAARRHEEEQLTAFGEQVSQVDAGLRCAQSGLDKVAEMQQALQQTAERIGADLCQVQERTLSQSEELNGSLEQQLTKFVSERPVNVDFGKVIGFIGKTNEAVCNDITFLLKEIGKIQQALNVDFVSVLDLRLNDLGKGLSESVATVTSRPSRKSYVAAPLGVSAKIKHRVRDSGLQTDSCLTAEAWGQTDFFIFGEHKKKKERRKEPKPKAKNMTVAKSAAQVGGVFADADKMKEQARLALIRPQYNVQDYYKTVGSFQHIARSGMFESVTLACILMNCIWMAVDADLNKADMLYDADPVFQVIENAFCVYFSFEITVRFLAFEQKKHAFTDFWFVFDLILVTLMVLETWIMTFVLMVSYGDFSAGNLKNGTILRVARTMKMLRISRMARLLRSVPELVILMKGVKAATRSVLVFLFMWMIIVFIFALVSRQLAPADTELFRSMPQAMNTFFMRGILAPFAPLVDDASREHFIFWPVVLIFVSLTVLILMNMLIGVIIEMINAIAVTEKEGMTALYVAQQMRSIYEEQGMHNEHLLTQLEFNNILLNPDVVVLVDSLGVDVMLLLDMGPNLFEDLHKAGGVGMSFEAFVELILSMRGTNPAKVKDLKQQLRVLKMLFQASQTSTEKVLHQVQSDLVAVREDVRELRDNPDRGGHSDSDSSSSGEEDLGKKQAMEVFSKELG